MNPTDQEYQMLCMLGFLFFFFVRLAINLAFQMGAGV
jgi:hypothetical protein